MKTQHFFSHFCKVQHRMAVSPQAAALFFFILGELSASGFFSNSIAIDNKRICGSIHISGAALRKCRDMLAGLGVISFYSFDGGKTPGLYTIRETNEWILDVINMPSPTVKSQSKAKSTPPDTEQLPAEPASSAPPVSLPTQIADSAPKPVPKSSPKPKHNSVAHSKATRINKGKKPTASVLRAAREAINRNPKHRIKLILRPHRPHKLKSKKFG